MSYMQEYKRRLSLAGINLSSLTDAQLTSLIAKILERGIHGISFSPYTEGQGPGTRVTEAQIRSRLDVIRPHVDWIRTFSCTEGKELIPAIAKAEGLRTLVGAWIEDDAEKNEQELENAIAAANAGHVDILAVGNEVLLRGDLAEDQLLDCLRRAREAVPAHIPVGYVDAYFLFENHPRIAAACDVILANCYPFWEGCPAEYALLYMKEMYRRAQQAGGGNKPVIVSETGWPNIGTAEGGAVPSHHNAIKYFVDTCQWADEEQIPFFWFSSFDETWKVEKEGDVGAYWGLWDAEGKPKYV